MAKESSWRKASRRKLTEILFEQTPRGEDESFAAWGKRLKQAIANGYPFAQRSGFAYQCWLSERKKLLAELGLLDPLPGSPRAKREAAVLVTPTPAGHGLDETRIQLPLPLEIEP